MAIILVIIHAIISPMTNSPKKCLIVGPSWVGDMIMAQSLFIQLKQQYPQMQIDVLAPQWSEALLDSMPEVSESHIMPVGHGTLGLKVRYQLGKSLRSQHYDWAITLPNSLKSALVPFWAKIPKRSGFRGEMRYGLINSMHHLDPSVLTMTVQRFVALAQPPSTNAPDYPAPKLSIDNTDLAKTLKHYKLAEQPFIALCPGAEYGDAKRWPAKHFANLANKLCAQGYQAIVLGSEKDQVVAKKIASQLNSNSNLVDLTGKTTLTEATHLLASAKGVVSNDSGLMHIAAAVNTPLVALYGSSDPHFTPPLSTNHKIIDLNLECSPCFKRECPLGTRACLDDIKPELVDQQLATLIQASK